LAASWAHYFLKAHQPAVGANFSLHVASATIEFSRR
jgi:hypothetical protein